MRESLRFKQRRVLGKLRKDILRMFVGIARKGGESFKLASCRKPYADVRAEFLLPSLRAKDDLRAPEHQDVPDACDHIAPRLQRLRHADQLSNRNRRSDCPGLEGGL